MRRLGLKFKCTNLFLVHCLFGFQSMNQEEPKSAFEPDSNKETALFNIKQMNVASKI